MAYATITPYEVATGNNAFEIPAASYVSVGGNTLGAYEPNRDVLEFAHIAPATAGTRFSVLAPAGAPAAGGIATSALFTGGIDVMARIESGKFQNTIGTLAGFVVLSCPTGYANVAVVRLPF